MTRIKGVSVEISTPGVFCYTTLPGVHLLMAFWQTMTANPYLYRVVYTLVCDLLSPT